MNNFIKNRFRSKNPVKQFSFQITFLLAFSFLIFMDSIIAQTALTGGLRGNITDSNGAVISGAMVSVESKSLSIKQESVTDANGRFTVLGLIPAGDYEIKVSAKGFRPQLFSSISVVSGETNVIDASIEVAAVNETVNVTGTENQLEMTPEISQVVSAKKLVELPIYNRGIQRAALLDPKVRNSSPLGGDTSNATRLSINGRIYRETHYELDGNNNTDFLFNNAPLQTVSLSSIQEFKILSNQYAAEHGGTTAGFVILNTKSGTNSFRGEGFLVGRPSGIQARPPLATRRIPNENFQYGASIGGPIIKDKTFFFANYEGTSQNRGSFVNLPRPQVFNGELRENLGLVKLDHRFTENHSAGIRVNGAYYTNTNTNDRITFLAQSAQPIQPSAAAKSTIQNIGVQANDLYTKGRFVNEFRISYVNARPSTSQPLNPQPVVIRNGVSTEGNSSFSNFLVQNVEIANVMSLQVGNHSLKFGGDITRQKIHETAFQQFGTFTFDSAGNFTRFTQQLGVRELRSGQTRYAFFVQDDFRLTKQLTLTFGLRHDYQTIVEDTNNFGPRVGFAYDVTGNGNTVIRGGGGVYYDQPFYHGFTQRYLEGGVNALTRTITLTPAQYTAAGLNLATFQSFDPRNLNAAPLATRNLFLRGEDIRSPYTIQGSIGIQQKISGDFIVNGDYIHNSSRKQLIVFNRNAAAPFIRTDFGQVRTVAAANATRPLTTFGGVPVNDVLVSVNAGNAEYNALSLGISKRFGNRYTFASNYVFADAKDSVTDDHAGANVNDFSDVIGAERAQSDFNQKHRFVTYGTVNLPYNLEFTGVATIASGLRINSITGVDNNGDGITVDRPFGFRRNAFVGPYHKRFDMSLVKKFAVLGENRRLELRADLFNVFNNGNFYRFNNVYGNGANPVATFGTALSGITSVDPGRQIQFGARFVF